MVRERIWRRSFCKNAVCPRRPYNQGMKFRVVLEYDADAKAYSAVCPELPGCASAGETEDDARKNIREAIALYLAPSA